MPSNSEMDYRIVVVNHDKCKPKSPAFNYLKAKSGICGKDCISIKDNKIIISEKACLVCFNVAKRAPDNAVMVVKLPTSLNGETIFRYSENSFKLHGLAIPRPGSVLGLLGINGIGKSTVLNILSGKILPNFGKLPNNRENDKVKVKYQVKRK